MIEFLLGLLVVEGVLRLKERGTLHFDVEKYPFYRRMKNARGRDPYFVEREGRENTAIMRTYSEGIRSNIAAEKRPIILTLGCSFAEGAAMTDEETFSGYLERFLGNKYGVVNAGIGGYGPFQISRMLADLSRYNPKIAVVQLLDFKRVPIDFRKIARARKELQRSQRLKRISMIAWHVAKLFNRFAGVRSAYVVRNYTAEQLWNVNKRYLDEMKNVCKKIQLVLFVWPYNDPSILHNGFLHEKVKDYCAKNNILSFDARGIYTHYNDAELQLKNDAHPNKFANRLIAKAAWKCLERNGLI